MLNRKLTQAGAKSCPTCRATVEPFEATCGVCGQKIEWLEGLSGGDNQ